MKKILNAEVKQDTFDTLIENAQDVREQIELQDQKLTQHAEALTEAIVEEVDWSKNLAQQQPVSIMIISNTMLGDKQNYALLSEIEQRVEFLKQNPHVKCVLGGNLISPAANQKIDLIKTLALILEPVKNQIVGVIDGPMEKTISTRRTKVTIPVKNKFEVFNVFTNQFEITEVEDTENMLVFVNTSQYITKLLGIEDKYKFSDKLTLQYNFVDQNTKRKIYNGRITFATINTRAGTTKSQDRRLKDYPELRTSDIMFITNANHKYTRRWAYYDTPDTPKAAQTKVKQKEVAIILTPGLKEYMSQPRMASPIKSTDSNYIYEFFPINPKVYNPNLNVERNKYLLSFHRTLMQSLSKEFNTRQEISKKYLQQKAENEYIAEKIKQIIEEKTQQKNQQLAKTSVLEREKIS